MQLFGSVSIARRLWTVVIVLSLALAALAGFAYLRLQAVVEAAQQTEHSRVPQLAQASAMELDITRVSLQIRHAMLAPTSAEREAALSDIAAKRQRVIDSAAAYEKDLYTERGKAMFQSRVRPAIR